MRKLLVVLSMVVCGGCSRASSPSVDARAGEKPPERPTASLPQRPAPSAPGGAYGRTGMNDDLRQNPEATPYAPETQKGYLAGPPQHGKVQLVDRNGDKTELKLTPHTQVERAGQKLGVEELSEGKQVRASYYFDGQNRYADKIELVAPDRDRR